MFKFKTIALMGRARNAATRETFLNLIKLLEGHQSKFLIAENVAKELNVDASYVKDKAYLAQNADIIIVVGGDGSMLRAACAVADYNIPIVGINRGRFGFLADIAPDQIDELIPQILSGDFQQESRMMLEVELPDQKIQKHALNDIVLATGDTAHMTEFEIYVDNHFMCGEHSDGMIVATPTGSTAYALSGGGPIIHPASKAMVLVPMFSHTLTSRPIVLNAESEIRFKIGGNDLASPPFISCDGRKIAALRAGEEVIIKRKQNDITLLHPKSYTYFKTLGRKLNWGKKLAKDE